MPRFLRAPNRLETAQTPSSADAAPPVHVQRDEATGGLERDPELDTLAARLAFRRLLDPDRLGASVLSLPYLDLPPFLTAPVPPAGAPLVPRGKGPEKARAAKPGDLLSGVLKIPSVKGALDRLGDDAADQAARDWGSLSRGGKTLVVSGSLFLGGGLLTGIVSDPDARGFLLGTLNGRVLPVPFTNGSLGFELNTKGDNTMVGIHLDVGRFLPSRFGFGRGKSTAIGAPPKAESITGGLSRKANCSCGGSCAECGGVKLSRPGDPAEREADHIADRIVRAESPGDPLRVGVGGEEVQRQAVEEQEEEDVQRKADVGASHGTHDLRGRIRGLERSGGEPLPPYVQSLFEHRLGADLRGVRVHTGGEAAELASATNAHAFTVGRSIAFAGGQYAPHTAAGQRLLAHELVHTVQNARS